MFVLLDSLISENDLSKLKELSIESIKRFAADIDIAPSIAAGRAAHELFIRGDNEVWKKVAKLRPSIKLEVD